MVWVRKDDQMPIHRKVAPLSDAAYRLLDEAICWCSRNQTDGRIGVSDLPEISRRGRPKNAAELVDRGLWHLAGGWCSSDVCAESGPDGWVIHDYLDYNPSKDKVIKEKSAKAERQRRWIEAKRQSRKPSVDAAEDASSDGPEDDAPPRPVPPRPEGSGAGTPRATAARREAGAGGGRKNKPLAGQRPNYDAIAQSAVQGQRRDTLAAEVRGAIRKPTPPASRRPNAFDELRAVTGEIATVTEEPAEEAS